VNQCKKDTSPTLLTPLPTSSEKQSLTQNKIRDNATYINVEAINNAELTKYFKPQNILLWVQSACK
jgi:hypothetical protein